jgi:transposase-like protein
MAKAQSMNLIEFEKLLGTEEKCEAYFMQKRWKDGFICPNCQHREYYYLQTRKLFECQSCKTQTSLTAGTLLHKSKLTLKTWFWAMYLVAHDKRGRSALSLSVVLDLNYRTAFRLLRKIREAMKERDVIEAATIEEITRVTKQCVKPGSKIVSDGNSAYRSLVKSGYIHEPKIYYKADKEEFLKSLHKMIGNAKAFILGTYHGLGKIYLQSYFDEFCFRFNRRFNPNEIFDRLLNACVLATPHPQT